MPETPETVENRSDKKILESYWVELFRTYIDNCLRVKKDRKERMRLEYSNITYCGKSINLNYDFETIYINHMSPSRRLVYKYSCKNKLIVSASKLFNYDNSEARVVESSYDFAEEILRKLYVVYMVWNYNWRYLDFCYEYKRKVHGGRKYRNPLPDFVKTSSNMFEAECARMQAVGGNPLIPLIW